MNKRIGIDIRMLGTRHGGIGRYVLELVRHVLRQDTENKYFLFSNKKSTEPGELESLKKFPQAEIVETGIRHYSVAEQVRLPRILAKADLDLVHFPNFNVPLLYRRPFVTTIHDTIHHKFGGVKKANWLHFAAYKKIITHAARASRAVITVSNCAKNDIAKTFSLPLERVHAIYEAGRLSGQSSEEKIEKVKHIYRLHRPYFLFVGVLQRNKNVVALTRGFDAFIKKYRLEMDLVLAGRPDPHYPDIIHHAQDITHRDRLVFTGYVEEDDLAALYAGAHAFVSASTFEGFGLPGVEAMQFGLPLAVSNIEVFNEIYDNAAVYFKPDSPEDIADKLGLLAGDTQYYDQMREKSLKRGQLFDWEKTAQQTLEIYNNV